MRALLLVPLLLAAPLLPMASAGPLQPACDAWALAGGGLCAGSLRVAGHTDTCLTGTGGYRLWTHFDGTITVDGVEVPVQNVDLLVAIPQPTQIFSVIGGANAKQYCRIEGSGAVAVLAHPQAADEAVLAGCDAVAGASQAGACQGVVVLRGTSTACPQWIASRVVLWSDFTGDVLVNGAVWQRVDGAKVAMAGVVESTFCVTPTGGNAGMRAVGVVLTLEDA